ncbi:hypothetical protein SCLCIDRAFT_1211708 [Scleroderma citrinum Foug A]|uniref:Uncharacterized protein n=1 Tax=Scleroderma citrinum Foug A TaxID=1036808 RepID=A0A0C2ZW91_9AGAM|nr:hypothetical protein SCLCIDRAFT_1211708 [Scleroderma citrinum Foug A]
MLQADEALIDSGYSYEIWAGFEEDVSTSVGSWGGGMRTNVGPSTLLSCLVTGFWQRLSYHAGYQYAQELSCRSGREIGLQAKQSR